MSERTTHWKMAAAATLAAALFICGCAVKPVAPANDPRVGEMQDEIQRIKRLLSEQKGGSGLPSPGWDKEAGRKLAELDEKLRQLDLENQALKGKIEELERGFGALKTPADPQRTEKIGGEVAAVTARMDAMSERVAEMGKAIDALSQQVQKSGGTAPPPVSAAPPKPPKEIYDEAYALYRDNKYPEAQAKFREYVERYPDTPLADNAIFWIGEAYYDQGQYEQAILQYDRVVQKYPNGDKVASSLLKQAFSFAAMGDNVSARILLKKVITEHAGSEQALIARKKLEVLGE